MIIEKSSKRNLFGFSRVRLVVRILFVGRDERFEGIHRICRYVHLSREPNDLLQGRKEDSVSIKAREVLLPFCG